MIGGDKTAADHGVSDVSFCIRRVRPLRQQALSQ
jgi:hypothetical protein